MVEVLNFLVKIVDVYDFYYNSFDRFVNYYVIQHNTLLKFYINKFN